ncbi:MAG: MucB/RseB C-terminal domain-containing protein [Sedimenticolaceae bacterium]
MATARLAAVGIGGLLLSIAGHAGDLLPHELLERMNEAVRTLDYEGRFVVQTGEQLDAMYIVHRADDGAEKERVVALNGEPREFIRSDEAIACLVPGKDQHINIGRRANGRSFSPLRGVSGAQLDATYRVELLEPARVAGREAHQVLIQPRDDLRFGYRLYVDKASNLPLRSEMLDDSQRIVSQMMFVELRVGQAITPIERDISAMQMAQAEPVEGWSSERLAPPAWMFDDLPTGFQLNVHRRRSENAADGPLEHFIFSDGLATVSVYVQPARHGGEFDGVSQRGAASAIGRSLDEHEVIVVGEVPIKTLQMFAQHIRPARP